MPNHTNHPIDRSCLSYRPGHQVHWIQAKKSWEEEQPELDVSIVVHEGGRVDLHGDELDLTVWNHDPARLRSAWDSWGSAVWKPRFHVLLIPELVGRAFNLATGDDHQPCVREADLTPLPETATALDRVRRDARELGGYTVRRDSLWAAVVAEEARGLRCDDFGVDW